MFTLPTQHYDRITPTKTLTERERRVARPLGLLHPVLSSEQTAFNWLKEQRWGADGETCPFCGTHDHQYFIASRKVWRCRSVQCGKSFSLFSQTKFHSTSLSPRTVATLLFLFQESAEGMSSRELAGLLGLDYRATHVQLCKLREALVETCDRSPLTGTVEVDACYFRSYVRPPNKGTGTAYKTRTESKSGAEEEESVKQPTRDNSSPAESKKDRETASGAAAKEKDKTSEADAKYRRNPYMHALIAFVQRLPEGGIGRVRVAVVRTENQVDTLDLVLKVVDQAATVVTDEHGAYTPFIAAVDEHVRLRHKTEFVTEDGQHSNTVECFFNEMRRAQAGAYHNIGLGYLIYYAHEMAWRVEMRDKPNDVRFADITKRALNSGRSKVFADVDNKRVKAGGEKVEKPSWLGIVHEVAKKDVPKAGDRKLEFPPQHRRTPHFKRDRPRPKARSSEATK